MWSSVRARRRAHRRWPDFEILLTCRMCRDCVSAFDRGRPGWGATGRRERVRIATRAGRAVLISADAATCVDVADASDGRFGPTPRQVFDEWEAFSSWVSGAAVD